MPMRSKNLNRVLARRALLVLRLLPRYSFKWASRGQSTTSKAELSAKSWRRLELRMTRPNPKCPPTPPRL